MFLQMFGGIGIGLAWGWLIGSLAGRVRRPFLTGLVISGATIPLAAEVLWLGDGRAMTAFLVAGGLALFIHLGWRRKLSHRFGPPG